MEFYVQVLYNCDSCQYMDWFSGQGIVYGMRWEIWVQIHWLTQLYEVAQWVYFSCHTKCELHLNPVNYCHLVSIIHKALISGSLMFCGIHIVYVFTTYMYTWPKMVFERRNWQPSMELLEHKRVNLFNSWQVCDSGLV